jgi:hypothetical protein
LSRTKSPRSDRALARWAAGRGDVTRLEIELPIDASLMASDGFHPGAPVYRVCARAAADCIVRDLAPALWPAIVRAGPSGWAGASASRRGRSRRR